MQIYVIIFRLHRMHGVPLVLVIAWSQSACLSVRHNREPYTNGEPIKMPFGLWTWVGPRNHVGARIPRGTGNLGVFGKIRKNTQNSQVSRSSVETVRNVHKCSLSFITARCNASAVLRQSVRPSQVGVLLKRLNVGLQRQHRTIAPGTAVFRSRRCPRNSFGVTPYGGAKCRWGGSKSATLDK